MRENISWFHLAQDRDQRLLFGSVHTLHIIIFLVITLMQGIYNYILETNHISGAYNVAAVLYLQSVVHVMLFRP